MELSDYLAVLRKYWRSITAATLIAVAGAAAFSALTPPTYTSHAALFVTVEGASSAGDLAQGTTFTQKQVESYVEVATSPMVLQPVIDGLGLDTTPAELAEELTVTVPTNTSVIRLAVQTGDPAQATAIAGAVGQQLVTAVSDLSPENARGQKAVTATVITPAVVPTSPTTPNVPQNLALGLLLGLFVGVGQALLRHTLDTRVRTAADVARVTDAPVVGRIALDETLAHQPILASGHRSANAEAFRRLRTNLQYLDAGQARRSFVVTSSVEDEGKTTTAINTATTLAETGLKVLLIDADMRKPKVASYVGIEGAAGLSTCLIGRATLDAVVQQVGTGSLHVLAAGAVPPNPAELLGSEAMRDLLAQATEHYDAVVIDAPPLLPVTDAAILARITSGALLVVSSGTVHVAQLAGAVESLESVDGRLLGVVLNKLPRQHSRYGGYYQEYVEATPAPVEGGTRRTGATERASARA